MSTEQEAKRLRDLKVTAVALGVALLAGLLIVALRYWPAYVWKTHNAWTVTGQTLVALLWSLAWTAAGFVLGFLFGIPKVIQGNNTAATAQQTGSNQLDEPYQMRVNTNLEEISDWLTKLIVGATLTQLVKIPGYVSRAAQFMAQGVGESGAPFAAAILIYFTSIGFLTGYILTRMFLSGAFALADRLPEGSEALVQSASLPGSDGGPNDPAVTKATAQLATVPISDALTAREANVLARSALVAKDPARALRAASVAVNHDSSDAQAQLNYAVALSMMNAASHLVLERLDSAHDLIPPDVDSRAREDMFNTLIYTALYQDPPDGFETAIRYGEQFTSKNQPSKASIWINLACAYGQKYAWLKAQATVDVQIAADVANKAIFSIQQALSKSPSSKMRFQQLTDPTNNDNDLSALARDNTQVRQLLDLPIAGDAGPMQSGRT